MIFFGSSAPKTQAIAKMAYMVGNANVALRIKLLKPAVKLQLNH
jgi:hypothetical protein